MSTRCRIGLMHEDGRIDSIRCWRDGYPEHVGNILANRYDTEELVTKLIKGGDMSDIDTDIDRCVYEHRNRKTDWEDCKPVTFRSLGAFLNSRTNEGLDYLYMFHQGKWNYINLNE